MLAVQSKCSNLLLPCEGALPRENGRIARAKRAVITFGSRAIRPASGGMSPLGHFQTKSEALSARVYWSGPPTRADVLALGKQGRRVRLVYLFTPPHRRSVRAITLSTSPISKLRAANDERRQAKRNSLADKLTAEAKILADLKIEKAAVEGERRKVEADLGQVKYLATAARRRRRERVEILHPRC